MLTGLLAGMLDPFLLAHVFWDEPSSMLCLMIAHRHAIAAFSADEQPLQEGWPFSRWAMFSIAPKDLTVLLQLLPIRFKLLPGNVAHMDILEEKRPVFLRDGLNMQGAIQPFARMGSSIAERPSVSRIPQNFQHAIVCQGRPMNRSGVRASPNTVWKEQVLVPKVLHRGPGRRCPLEGRKEHPKGVFNLGIGIKMNGIFFYIHQPDWQLELERGSL